MAEMAQIVAVRDGVTVAVGASKVRAGNESVD